MTPWYASWTITYWAGDELMLSTACTMHEMRDLHGFDSCVTRKNLCEQC
jgi:hypothetical protein